MLIANPFKTLGFAQSAIRGLNDKEIASLVRALYRAQSAINHPDIKKGSDSKAKKLNEAYEALDQEKNPGEYAYWKEEFLRNRKDKIAETTDESRRLKVEVVQLENRFRDIWISFMGIGFSKDVLPALNCTGVDVLIASSPADYLNHKSALEKLSNAAEVRRYYISLEGKTNMFSILRMVDGWIKRIPLVKKLFSNKNPIPKLAKPEWVFGPDNIGRGSYLVTPSSYATPKQKDNKEVFLIGSLPEKIQRSGGEDSYKLLMPSVESELFDQVRDGFTWDHFRPVIADLEPILAKGRYVVGIKVVNNEPRFVIYGRIVQIKHIAK